MPSETEKVLDEAAAIIRGGISAERKRQTFTVWMLTAASAGNVVTWIADRDCTLITFAMLPSADNVALTLNVGAPQAVITGVGRDYSVLWYPMTITVGATLITTCRHELFAGARVNLTAIGNLARGAYLLFEFGLNE